MDLARDYSHRTSQMSEMMSQLLVSYVGVQRAFEEQKYQMIDYKHKAHYWEAQFKQIQSRESELKNEMDELKAKLRKREHQLFGRSSEKKSKQSEKKPMEIIKKNHVDNNQKIRAQREEIMMTCRRLKKPSNSVMKIKVVLVVAAATKSSPAQMIQKFSKSLMCKHTND